MYRNLESFPFNYSYGVWVCVGVRERGKERERGRERDCVNLEIKLPTEVREELRYSEF